MASDGVDEQLATLRKQIGKALRRGDQVELGKLRDLYARLKREGMEQAERDHMARVRASRVARQAPQPASSGRWRLPAGFGRSPLAVERDRRPPEPEPEQIPHGGHVSPWRRGGSPASEVIWP